MAVLLRALDPDDWELWRRIRLAALADAPDAFGATLAGEERYDEQDWREDLAEGRTVAVLDDDVPVACGAVFEKAPGRAAVVAMWTHPAHRGGGHATTVLDALVAWAAERALTVELGVNRLNGAARSVYERYGFVATGRSHPLRDGSDHMCDIWRLARRANRG